MKEDKNICLQMDHILQILTIFHFFCPPPHPPPKSIMNKSNLSKKNVGSKSTVSLSVHFPASNKKREIFYFEIKL